MKVKMLVQSQYKSELLRLGKVYEINDKTANRWVLSGLAEKAPETDESKPAE
ncbi:hypothetical protein SAMN05421839_10912 [Halolactibacillus halophilus]|uniref:Uncharacterized protein n=1 Tax=Halolactibacillus halophilus TaxID=306540 RepID=A0A1I5NEU5_9BACI|nr:hypothetical protein [Halolactibacillus halophilus]GEM01300.1 hypothetical protein HHA03_08320 [Halolactibacillus halophilus]SFP20365.1 hypothetical protein SAMN05421839_10912 [Halolactibacillus halophilus]